MSSDATRNYVPNPQDVQPPFVVKSIYWLLTGLALVWFGSRVVNAFETQDFWFLLAVGLVAYLVHDTGKVLMRGRVLGRRLAFFWGLLAVIHAGVVIAGLAEVGNSLLTTLAYVYGGMGVLIILGTMSRNVTYYIRDKKATPLTQLALGKKNVR